MTEREEKATKTEGALAEIRGHSGSGHDDPIGFAGLGAYFPNGSETVYVRKRLRPGADAFAFLAKEVEGALGPLVAKGGGDLPSVGGFARAGISRLETVRNWVSALPSDRQAEVARILLAAWQGGQNQTIALLRDGGLLNAKRGLDLAIRMKAVRASNRDRGELLHPSDKRDFPKMKALIEAAENTGKWVSERDAARAVLFPDVAHIPANADGAKKRREIDSLRNRYRRWKKNLGR